MFHTKHVGPPKYPLTPTYPPAFYFPYYKNFKSYNMGNKMQVGMLVKTLV